MRLDHVAFAVDDLEAAIGLFAGLPVGPVREFDAEDTREAYVEISPVRVLLLQPRGRSGPLAGRRGLHHLGFLTEDVRKVLSGLRHWLVCPSTLRNPDGPAWIVRPRENLLFEISPGEVQATGPSAFHQVVLEVPDIADAHRLFLTLGIEGDVPVLLRKGERRYVEIDVNGKRRSFDGERVQ